MPRGEGGSCLRRSHPPKNILLMFLPWSPSRPRWAQNELWMSDSYDDVRRLALSSRLEVLPRECTVRFSAAARLLLCAGLARFLPRAGGPQPVARPPPTKPCPPLRIVVSFTTVATSAVPLVRRCSDPRRPRFIVSEDIKT